MNVADAVVIGAGPNGLVAANLLVDAGWDVVVVEAEPEPGGAVRTAEVTAPGFRNDLFSAFYPLAAASPVMQALDLGAEGLRWSHAPTVLAHPRPGAPAALLLRDAEATAAALEAASPGDGVAWLALHEQWQALGPGFLRMLLSPFPPVRAAASLAAGAGRGLLELARLALLPVRRLVEERFTGPGPGLLLAGNALHADLTPESPPSALLGWMLCSLGHQVGFPVPEGGAGELTAALVRRLERRGGRVLCGDRVERVLMVSGRAVGVATAGGTTHRARHAVLADCDAVALYLGLVGEEHLPPGVVGSLARFHRASGTVKVDWALDGPIPWTDPTVKGAGTVHVADSLDELTMTSSELATGMIPARPFLLVGQMTTADPTRSPAGTESAWAYTHVPQTVAGDAAGEIDALAPGDGLDRFVERMEARIERLAPGFGELVLARHAMGPAGLEARDANLVGGDIGGGTSQLHQQFVFRPIPGLGRAETPIPRLFLASSSAHPGGAVHGACGANAARAAIAHRRARRASAVALGAAAVAAVARR